MHTEQKVTPVLLAEQNLLKCVLSVALHSLDVLARPGLFFLSWLFGSSALGLTQACHTILSGWLGQPLFRNSLHQEYEGSDGFQIQTQEGAYKEATAELPLIIGWQLL